MIKQFQDGLNNKTLFFRCWMTDEDGMMWRFIIPVAVMILVHIFLPCIIYLHCCCSIGFHSIPTTDIVQVLLLSG